MKIARYQMAFASFLLVTGNTQAALINRGGGLIYDDVLNITWLQDASYAKTSGYDSDGQMDWYQATTWADSLTYFDSVRGVTYDDWRLPITVQPDLSCSQNEEGGSLGYGCTGSEMGHLYYVDLGGVAGTSLAEQHNANYSLFINVLHFETNSAYWTSPGEPTAWHFNFEDGGLGSRPPNSGGGYAWAVRDGDVAAVPEPSTYAMFLAGLGLVGLAVRPSRKKV